MDCRRLVAGVSRILPRNYVDVMQRHAHGAKSRRFSATARRTHDTTTPLSVDGRRMRDEPFMGWSCVCSVL